VSDSIRVARPPILDRIDPTRHVVIEASAGTGKTYTLEHLVAELVIAHAVPLEQILVVTFTDKATREMRERVRATLRRVLDPPEPAAEDEPAWEIDADARRRVADALAVFDRAPISTIHAFCQRVLTENAFDCARLLRQEQVESREVFGRAFRDELRVALVDGEPLRPVIELAVSSWGVARIEAALYRWYAERGRPEPPFERARAREALVAMPTAADLGSGGTVGRLLADGLKRNPKKVVPERLKQLAPIVERVAAGAPIFEALLEYWAWAEADAPGRTSNIRYLRKYLGKATSPRLAPLARRVEDLAASAGTMMSVLVGELLPRVVARLSGRKSERGHFDFDDMLRMLRDALAAEGGEALIAELRRRYRVALVDEFQDTDRVQWDVFRTIFFDHDGGPWRLMVIGDPKQAIYGFRNADVYTYHAAAKQLVAAGGSAVPLEVSYRSTGPFLEALNEVLADGFFTGVNEYPHPVRCGRPELRAVDRAGHDVPPVTLLHLVGRPELRARWVARALAEHVAETIGDLLAGALRVVRDDDGPRALSPSDIHVLCRSRGDAETVGAALTDAGVPHAFYKQEGLFSTAAARHVWEVLRAVEDPGDRVRRLHAWLTPFFAVPLSRLEDCRDLRPDHPLVARLRQWRALADAHRWSTLFSEMLDGSGLVRRELFAASAERDLTDYQHVLEILLEESHRGRRSLPQLVARLGALLEGTELPSGQSGDVQRLESERAAVQVLTMHKSKGLEAEVVFLVGGLVEPSDDRLGPRVVHAADGARLAWVGDPPAEVKAQIERERREEAERLLYVAMTRARSKLYVPYFGPPPPGGVREAEASYELTVEPPEPERGQLALFFADPELPEPAPTDDTYRLDRMSGPYRVLNERLGALVAAGRAESPRFERTVVPVTPPGRAARDAALALSGWRPGVLPPPPAPDPRFDRARAQRGGFDITSYTRMKRLHREASFDEGADSLSGAQEPDVALPPAPDELPGGSAVGVFLHEVLEELPFEAIGEGDLLDDDALAALFERRARANAVAVEHLPAAAALVRDAMRAPLALADGEALAGGLAQLSRRVAEMPFLLPIPERGHPALDAAPPGPDHPPLAIERGFIRGVIDLVAEHAGRYHVVDYKSDRLVGYGPEPLATHVEASYAVQARLYTLGALRALRIHDADDYEARFGGLLYAFLRGMAEGEGVWVSRPDWSEVLAWERDLLDDAPWGHPLPPRRSVTR